MTLRWHFYHPYFFHVQPNAHPLPTVLTNLPRQSHLGVGEVFLDLLEHVVPVSVHPVRFLPHFEHALAFSELGLRAGSRQLQKGDVAVGPFNDLVGRRKYFSRRMHACIHACGANSVPESPMRMEILSSSLALARAVDMLCSLCQLSRWRV